MRHGTLRLSVSERASLYGPSRRASNKFEGRNAAPEARFARLQDVAKKRKRSGLLTLVGGGARKTQTAQVLSSCCEGYSTPRWCVREHAEVYSRQPCRVLLPHAEVCSACGQARTSLLRGCELFTQQRGGRNAA